MCRIGLRAWHDSEAVHDEGVVRRLLELDLGNDGDEEERQTWKLQHMEVSDEEVMGLLKWVLEGDDDGPGEVVPGEVE